MRRLALVVAVVPGCLWISRAEHADREDVDGDGIVFELDCDDSDPLVFPSNIEDPCDGRDGDCDPATRDGAATVAGEVFDTVQAAIDDAEAGATVVVCAGTHAGALVVSRELTLTGALSPEATVLDATGEGGPALTVAGSGATIRNLTLTGGTGGPNPRPDLVDAATIGGGLLAIDADGTVLLEDVVVSGNTADAGAGIFGPAADALELLRVEVRDNVAGGLGGGLVVASAATLNASPVAGNVAADGGGVAVLAGAAATALGGTVVSGNAATRGGGAWVAGTWSGGALEDNTADADGGGVRLEGGALAGATVDRNTAAAGGGVAGHGSIEDASVRDNGAARGGGVSVDGDLELRGAVVITGNHADGGDGGGVEVVAGELTASEELEIAGNRADGGAGGGIAATGGSLDLVTTRIAGNFAARGGGIAVATGGGCAGCSFSLTSVELSSNEATGAGGGLWTDAFVEVSACETEGNVAGTTGGGVHVAEGGSADVNGGSLSANSAGQVGGGLAVYATLATTTVGGVVVSGNAAADGAAVRIGPSAIVDCASSDVRDQVLTGAGGAAISLERGDTTPTTYDSRSTEYTNNAGANVNAGPYTYAAAPDTFACTWSAGAGQGLCTP